jgi:hypothetical protein
VTEKLTREEAGRIARRRAKADLSKKHTAEYQALIGQHLGQLGHGEAPAKKPAPKPRTPKR